MVEIAPSKVLRIVPEATTAQIADFLKVAEASMEAGRKRGRQESRGTPVQESVAEDNDAISLIGQLREPQQDHKHEGAALSCPTEEKSQLMNSLRKLVPPENGGNKETSVNFSEDFQKKILNLLDAASSAPELGRERCEKM